MVMPVVIALVLVPIQVGLWWHASQLADAAAREAVDAAQVAGADETDGVAAAFRFLAAAGNLTDTEVTVTRSVDTVTAEVTGRAPRLIPGLDWDVTATAIGSVERFIPEPEAVDTAPVSSPGGWAQSTQARNNWRSSALDVSSRNRVLPWRSGHGGIWASFCGSKASATARLYKSGPSVFRAGVG